MGTRTRGVLKHKKGCQSTKKPDVDALYRLPGKSCKKYLTPLKCYCDKRLDSKRKTPDKN